jgi:TonB family protein
MWKFATGMLAATALMAQGLIGGLGGPTAEQAGARPIGNGVSAPRPVRRFDPMYSEEARACSVQGPVLLGIVVNADGSTGSFRIVRPLGYGLDEQAVAAVRQWTFQPGVLQGKPVPVVANVEVNFRLLENPVTRPGQCDDFLNALRLLSGNGVTKDEAGGVRLLEAAAAKKLAEAQYRLASLYEYGDAGVTLDDKRATALYRACAHLVRCQTGLGRVLVSDSMNRVEGMAWLDLAADGGSAEARELYTKELKFTPEPQREQARALKKILLPK